MIKDKLKNAKTYYPLSSNLKLGLEWLINNDLEGIPNGKYEILGDKVYANVQEYQTKTTAKYESHRKYIDIQYIVQGKELVGVSDLSNCKTCIEYDCNSDLEFFDIETEEEYLSLNAGEILILYPNDAHKPSIDFGEKSFVKKIVVKVSVD